MMKKMMKRTISLLVAVSVLMTMPVLVSAEVVKEYDATSGEMTRMGEDFESYTVGTQVAAGTTNGLYSSANVKYAGDASNKYLMIDQAVTDGVYGGALFFAPNATDIITLTPGNKYAYNIKFMVASSTNPWNVTNPENVGVRFTPALNFGKSSWTQTSMNWDFTYNAPKGIRNNGAATDFDMAKFALNTWYEFKIILDVAAGNTADTVNLTTTAYIDNTLASAANSTTTLTNVSNIVSSFGIKTFNTVSYASDYTLALDDMYLSVYNEDLPGGGEDLPEEEDALREYDANGKYTYIGDDFESYTPGFFTSSNTDEYYVTGETNIVKDDLGNQYLTTNHDASTGYGAVTIIPKNGASFALAKGKKFLYNLDFRTEPTDWDPVYTGTAISPWLGYTTDWAKHAIWTIANAGIDYANAEVNATDTGATVDKPTQYGTTDTLAGFLKMNGAWNNVQVIIEVIDEDTSAGTYKLSTKMLVNGVMMGTEDMSAPAEVLVNGVKGLYCCGIKFKQTSATDRIIHFDNLFITEYDESLVASADKNLLLSSASIANAGGSASISLKPVTQKNQEVFEAIVAAYDGQGRMLDARVEKVTVNGFNFGTLNKAALTLPAGTKEVKGFIWRDLNNLVPLTTIEPIVIN